jgi:hypothetical protein
VSFVERHGPRVGGLEECWKADGVDDREAVAEQAPAEAAALMGRGDREPGQVPMGFGRVGRGHLLHGGEEVVMLLCPDHVGQHPDHGRLIGLGTRLQPEGDGFGVTHARPGPAHEAVAGEGADELGEGGLVDLLLGPEPTLDRVSGKGGDDRRYRAGETGFVDPDDRGHV